MRGISFIALLLGFVGVSSAFACYCPDGQNPITNWDNKKTYCIEQKSGKNMGLCTTEKSDYQKKDTSASASCSCPSDYRQFSFSGFTYCMKGGSEGVVLCESVVAKPSIKTETKTSTSTKTSTTKNTEKKIEDTGKSATGNQAEAQRAAGSALNYGASSKASVGIVRCADGANQERAVAGSGGGALADCQQNFADADTMIAMANRTGTDAVLVPDLEVLESEDALSTLAKFEKNFGVNKDDYVSSMLSSRNRMAEFSDLLKSEISEERLKQIAEDAKVEAPVTVAEAGASGVITASAAKKKTDTSLRDSLKQKLTGGARAPASMKTDYSSIEQAPVTLKNLQPDAALQGVIQGTEENREQELSIFDVVRSKYREFTARQKLD